MIIKPATLPDRELRPPEQRNMFPHQIGYTAGGDLLATVKRESGQPFDDPAREGDRYEVELTPPPSSVSGCTREYALALAESYARLLDHFFSEL